MLDSSGGDGSAIDSSGSSAYNGAAGTAVQASMVLKVVFVASQGVPSAASSADSAAVCVAAARSTAALECLARLAVEG